MILNYNSSGVCLSDINVILSLWIKLLYIP
jgi:hypothetical protein